MSLSKIRWLVGISIPGDDTANIIVSECEIRDGLTYESDSWTHLIDQWMIDLNITIAHVFIDRPDVDQLVTDFELSVTGKGPKFSEVHKDNIEYIAYRPVMTWLEHGVA